MAATQTRPAGYTQAPRYAAERARDEVREHPAPLLLAAGLAIAVLYAAFASGAIRIPDESRLQLIVAAVALPTLAATLFGTLRFEASGRAVAGIGLLTGFAAWSALSITWSIAPDETWLEVNRAFAYALVAGMGVVLGSSLPRAIERVALGYLAIATLVALYALGGKLVPWVEIPGLFDLDHANGISRLRAPIEYWNALGLFCVLAVPVAVRAAADLERTIRVRAAALVSLVILLTTLALTYSRGGLLVLVAALGLLVAMGPGPRQPRCDRGHRHPGLAARRARRSDEQRPHLHEGRRAFPQRAGRRRRAHARGPAGGDRAGDGAAAPRRAVA